MESSGAFSLNPTMRKKRSDRRPQNDIQPKDGNSSLSSSPTSNYVSKGLSGGNVHNDINSQRKIVNMNQCNSRSSYTNLADAEMALSSEFEAQESNDDKDTGVDTSEVFASNYKDIKYDTLTSDGHNSGSLEVDADADADAKGVDNVVKKVKLKVGGVTRTIHAKPASDVTSMSKSSSLKPPQSSTSSRLKQKPVSEENPDGSGLRGILWKDFSRSGFSVGKADSITEENSGIKNAEKHDSVHKSKRVAKMCILHDDEDEDEDDAELRYLAKMKLKSGKVDDEDEGGSKKQRKISSVVKMETSRLDRERKKSKSEDTDYTGEEGTSGDMFGEDSSREMTVTTRRQAHHSGRGRTNSTASVVEFPNGLPPAPPRKQKDKVSEVEHQLKKAEAAQRRKMQAAKAAQESEAEAIRKILGQDSSRKKRENKMKQRQEELAQERVASGGTLASNSVRWVIGPTRTVVTFSDDIGLPNIFESKPCSYPGPREKCAGPSCSEPFKYRDSRSKLPLCSLQCYKRLAGPGAGDVY